MQHAMVRIKQYIGRKQVHVDRCSLTLYHGVQIFSQLGGLMLINSMDFVREVTEIEVAERTEV